MAQAADSARLVVGLTGGIGSGKTTVANAFGALGATLIDTDEIARALTAPDGEAMPRIAADFGPGFITQDGAMNRSAMRARVFSDPAAKKRLEDILHPMIRTACQTALQELAGPYALLIVPLLVETGHYLPWCQRVLVVDCDEATQLQRVMQRSGLSRTEALKIIASQATREARLAAADDVIDNSGSPLALPAQVSLLHQRYITAARNL
ncbi:dephospho-CoA kinase [Uliginosibacterium paludis]|uniref:Dephospho-CoA kinase n=1 Tax=Uliginosibacterium paludis TaxID=1615952 RepID=A0ABV2CMM6_9RHOO